MERSKDGAEHDFHEDIIAQEISFPDVETREPR